MWQLKHPHIAVRMENWHWKNDYFGKVHQYLIKFNITLRYLSRRNKNRHSHENLYLNVFSGFILEKATAPHSSTLAWKIPWTEEPGRLQSIGSLRVRHN